MFNKLKTIWRSVRFTETLLKKGSVFYGPAKQYLENVNFEQGTENWKNSKYSFKLVVDRIESNKVYYYSYYIDPEGNENIQKHVKFIATKTLLKDINNLRLIVD